MVSFPINERVVKVKGCPAFIIMEPFSKEPKRISGPFVSNISAMGICDFFEIFRTRSIRFLCSSWVPWEKLKRAIFMPELIKFSIISGVCELGPKVQTIFVFLGIYTPPFF